MIYNFLPTAYLQGEFLPFDEAKISIATHSLHYGTAAFGGLRGMIESSNNLILFRLDDHCKRLSNSAKFLRYNISKESIKKIIIELIQANKPKNDIYIRPLVYTSDLGISPRIENLEKDLLMYAIELGDYFDGRISCCFGSWMRQDDRSFPLRGKISGGYITSALAKSEAVERGYDEAILMNTQGKVCEATGMNIFMVRGGQLITPSVNQDILEGVTRDSIMTLARDMGLTVIERAIDKSELIIADEVFLTGTAAKITSVRKIENYDLPESTPITNQLISKFRAITSGVSEDYQDWLTRVSW